MKFIQQRIALLLTAIVLFFLSTETAAQIQIGNDIDGQWSSDYLGWSVSMPDSSHIAIGAPYHDANNQSNVGHVRVYRRLGNTWVQKGLDIDGEGSTDFSGHSVSMPDSNTVAIGAPGNDVVGTDAGHVRVYSWNGTAWIQKGNDIDGESIANKSGHSVSMPDANTVAIGAWKNSDNGNSAGHVRIFSWNGSNWVQKGLDIDGEGAVDLSGYAVSMPNSNTVAIGAPRNDGGATDAGQVRVYIWLNNTWTQKGADIDGTNSNEWSGWSVSMPDINTVAVGSMNNGNNNENGKVKIYEWNGTAWQQKGSTIQSEAAGDRIGYALSMPNANYIAVGASRNDGNGTDAGHVRIYSWYNNSWVQNGIDIDGEAANDRFGSAVSMPDQFTVGIGARFNDNSGTNRGHARIYALICNSSTSTISPVVCNNYTSPSGTHNWATSGTYYDTIVNATGCDSIITINLTVNQQTTNTITIATCNTYTSPSGNYTWTNSGTYTDTLQNTVGCDSIITINLTINNATTSTIAPTVCDQYTSPSGGQTWTSSGTYTDTIQNTVGCDSIITINLSINNSTTNSITPIACDQYTSPSGNQIWTTSGTYYDTLQNTIGCDSVITVNLTINSTTTSSISPIACDQYTSPSGNQIWTTSGTYHDTIQNTVGCDSIITLNLTINTPTMSTINPTACNQYTSPSGNQTWTTSGTYYDTIQNTVGCDSIITINLTVNTVDLTVINTSPTLTASGPGLAYQWLNCDNGMSIINGETNASFTAIENGNYAVIITENGCIDTSACQPVANIGLSEIHFKDQLTLFPNPTNGECSIQFDQTYTAIQISIRNQIGQLIEVHQLKNTDQIHLNIPHSPGIYFITVNIEEQMAVLKIIKT